MRIARTHRRNLSHQSGRALTYPVRPLPFKMEKPMKAKEFLNSHKLVVISDFIKSIEAIPEQKWLHDFMQDE